MMVTNKGSLLHLLRWQWRVALTYATVGAAVVLIHDVKHVSWFEIPSWPLTVVGAALGIFVSFRTNSGYDRWWEGRKLWGRLVNTSRVFASQVHHYVQGEGPERNALIHGHIAYVHLFRTLLRRQDPLADSNLMKNLDDSLRFVLNAPNPTFALVDHQLSVLTRLADEGRLDARRLQSIDTGLQELLDIQGGCERINNTPFPAAYGYVADRLILVYGIMLPLALVDTLGWATVPLNLLVCMSFVLISEIGRALEAPFSVKRPALPLHSLTLTIERDLRHAIEEGVPARLEASSDGVLM